MFKLTALVTVREGADGGKVIDALNSAASDRVHIVRSILEPTLPNTSNGGNYIWHLQFPEEAAYRAWKEDSAGGKKADAALGDRALVHQVDSMAYAGGRVGTKRPLDHGVYRLLVLSVNRAASEVAVAQFDSETYEMGLYIPSILNWQLSRVVESSGARRWTHVWEQEFENLDGLLRTYMLHPYHWGWINRWYDPECTEHMIDNYLCHSFCNFTGQVIAQGGSQ